MNLNADPPRNLGEKIDDLLYRWDEQRRRPVVVVAVVFAAVATLALTWSVTRRSAVVEETRIDDRIPIVSLDPTSAPTTVPSPLIVHVTGAVRTPGVYELRDGDRILDAISAAGGATSEGQPDRLNLAAPVTDGMQVRVPVEGEAAIVVGPPGDQGGSGPVDLNTASAAQLEALPGIGPATAAAILSHREELGRFGSVADLLGVRGIGEAKLAALEELVVVR